MQELEVPMMEIGELKILFFEWNLGASPQLEFWNDGTLE